MRFKWSGVAACALAIGVLSLPALALPRAGGAAPAFSGKTTAGKAISLGQYKGKVVLLNFFNRY